MSSHAGAWELENNPTLSGSQYLIHQAGSATQFPFLLHQKRCLNALFIRQVVQPQIL